MSSKHRAIFLDRDGILVVPQFRDGRSFAPRTMKEFEIYAEAPRCVTWLQKAGFKIVVVSNQPDVGAGLISRNTVDAMNTRLRNSMPLDAVKVCFHTKEQRCDCRKPLPGMLLEAAAEIDIDLSASVMVGDRASDIQAGAAAGCRTIFVDLHYMAEPRPSNPDPDKVVESLSEATNWILSLG
jgi:D-glycero-D-manno-heptose 1,7-bisphosphate phosphatase